MSDLSQTDPLQIVQYSRSGWPKGRSSRTPLAIFANSASAPRYPTPKSGIILWAKKLRFQLGQTNPNSHKKNTKNLHDFFKPVCRYMVQGKGCAPPSAMRIPPPYTLLPLYAALSKFKRTKTSTIFKKIGKKIDEKFEKIIKELGKRFDEKFE